MRFNAAKRCHTLVVIKTFSNITNYRNLNTEFEPRFASVTNIRDDRALIQFSYVNLFSMCKSSTYIIFLTNFSEKVAIFNVLTFWADFFFGLAYFVETSDNQFQRFQKMISTILKHLISSLLIQHFMNIIDKYFKAFFDHMFIIEKTPGFTNILNTISGDETLKVTFFTHLESV